MKSLIICTSESENIAKLAETILDTLEGEKEICHIGSIPLGIHFDMVFIGFEIRGLKPDLKSMSLLSSCKKGARLFLFATHAADQHSPLVSQALDLAVSLVNGPDIVGMFSCQGEINPVILQKMKHKHPVPEWVREAENAQGHPDEADQAALRKAVEKACSLNGPLSVLKR